MRIASPALMLAAPRGVAAMSSAAGPMQRALHETLTAALAPVHLVLENESHKHSVPAGSESHFKLLIVSAAFEGKALGSIALVSNEESGSDKETDDLMRICKGRKMRILVAHRDSLSGCGAWCKAAGTNSQKSHFLACI